MVRQMNFRSDFEMKFLDLVEDLTQAFKKEEEEEENIMESKNGRKENENVDMIINVGIENIIIDVFPYYNYSYYQSQTEKELNLDSKKMEDLYHCGMRALLAIESVEISLSKNNKKINFDGFEISAIDVLLKNTKYPLTEPHNTRILRSGSFDRNLFDRDLEELESRFGFLARPIRLAEFKVKRNENGDFEVVLQKF